MIKQHLRKIGLTVGYILWVVGVFFVVSAIAGIWIRVLAPQSVYDWFDSPLGNFTLAAIVYTLAGLVVLLPYTIKRLKKSEILQQIGLKHRPTGGMLGWAFVLWACYFATTLVVTVVLYMINIPGLDLQQVQEIGFRGMTQPYEFIVAFLALVVFAPVFEELMFRGYLFGRLRRLHKYLLSAVLTSLVFGAVHMQLNVAIDTFILGMFMSYARERFDSVYPPIFMHMIKNGFAYALLFIAPLWGINLI